jgi:hypothetical protein
MGAATPTTVYRLVSQSNNLGTWLTFTGAITVAVIAAGTAQWRLRSQLSAEMERELEKQSFDRGETDRAELRSILDALAEALGRLQTAVYVFTARLEARLDIDEQDPHEAKTLRRPATLVLALAIRRSPSGDDSAHGDGGPSPSQRLSRSRRRSQPQSTGCSKPSVT